MSYGLKVWDAYGNPRVYEDSWFMKFRSNEQHTVGPNGTKNVYFSGFDPTSWGVANLRVNPQGDLSQAGKSTVTLHSGYVQLKNLGNYQNITFIFTVLKG